MQVESATDKDLEKLRESYILSIENKFRILTPKIADYKTSKTDKNINTIRHGFNLLKRGKELAFIRRKVILEKAHCDLDNDFFTNHFDTFLSSIESNSIIAQINEAFENLTPSRVFQNEVSEIISALEIYNYSFDECIQGLTPFVLNAKMENEFEGILTHIRLYNIDQPFVALASNYGVQIGRAHV